MCVEFISSGFPFISNFSPRQILLILSGGSFCFNATPVLLATTFSEQWIETDFESRILISIQLCLLCNIFLLNLRQISIKFKG